MIVMISPSVHPTQIVLKLCDVSSTSLGNLESQQSPNVGSGRDRVRLVEKSARGSRYKRQRPIIGLEESNVAQGYKANNLVPLAAPKISLCCSMRQIPDDCLKTRKKPTNKRYMITQSAATTK
jgi:hypothetical protein